MIIKLICLFFKIETRILPKLFSTVSKIPKFLVSLVGICNFCRTISMTSLVCWFRLILMVKHDWFGNMTLSSTWIKEKIYLIIGTMDEWGSSCVQSYHVIRSNIQTTSVITGLHWRNTVDLLKMYRVILSSIPRNSEGIPRNDDSIIPYIW